MNGTKELPTILNVLFVDDDTMLRKMFSRTLKRLAPDWQIQEASNGETALRMVDTARYDVIFMDQYMASVEKQLLGTETVRAMRAKGVDSIICGLSANDTEEQFKNAGADAFMLKPFPCQNEALKRELLLILTNYQPSSFSTDITVEKNHSPIGTRRRSSTMRLETCLESTFERDIECGEHK
jgi:CheY-like chemotaxis protein